ncbi:hypothetical protein SAMN05444745_1119 [Arthrobacter sp. OV608]|nr:hypothetical protein SAMN05444745_1119 [Arthrobacter sp. OV608]
MKCPCWLTHSIAGHEKIMGIEVDGLSSEQIQFWSLMVSVASFLISVGVAIVVVISASRGVSQWKEDKRRAEQDRLLELLSNFSRDIFLDKDIRNLVTIINSSEGTEITPNSDERMGTVIALQRLLDVLDMAAMTLERLTLPEKEVAALSIARVCRSAHRSQIVQIFMRTADAIDDRDAVPNHAWQNFRRYARGLSNAKDDI